MKKEKSLNLAKVSIISLQRANDRNHNPNGRTTMSCPTLRDSCPSTCYGVDISF
ncbi:MAG: hypothetical protein ACEPOV_06530 [Hyphomicrobiales bacterium]